MAAPRTKPVQKRLSHEERREIVLKAAREVFMEQGFGGASMRPIAARAGITEAMLYRISPSKLDLFEDAVAGPLEEAVNVAVELSQALIDITDMEDIRARCIKFSTGLMAAMQEIAPLLMAVLMTDREAGEHFYQHRFEPALAQVVEVITSDETFWHNRPVAPDFVVRSVFGMCWFLALDARFGSRPEASAEQLADHIVGLMFDGIGPAD